MKPDKREHPVIWLQPWCAKCESHAVDVASGRTWCQDNVYDECECGQKAVKYVRADDEGVK